MQHSRNGCAMLLAMRQLAVFIGASLAIFLGLLAFLVAVALAEGNGLISCRENCSPSDPVLGEIPVWRMVVATLVSLTAGAVAARRYA